MYPGYPSTDLPIAFCFHHFYSEVKFGFWQIGTLETCRNHHLHMASSIYFYSTLLNMCYFVVRDYQQKWTFALIYFASWWVIGRRPVGILGKDTGWVPTMFPSSPETKGSSNRNNSKSSILLKTGNPETCLGNMRCSKTYFKVNMEENKE